MSGSQNADRNVPAVLNAAGSPALQSERILMVREVNQANNLRDYLSIFFKHKRMIIVSFLVLSILGCALALVYNDLLYAPRFQARSAILVKFGWENYYPDPSLGKRESPAVDQSQMLGAEISILESRDLKEKVISALTPEAIFPGLATQKVTGLSKQDVALLLLDKYMKIEPAAKGEVIEVTFDGANPQSAAAVVNQLVSDYIDKRSEIYKDPKSALFLQNKVDFYRQKLAESLSDLKAFSEKTKIIDFDQERVLLLKQRSELNAALNGTANEIKEVEQTILELGKQLKAIPQSQLTAAASDRTGDAQSKLLGLKLQEQQLTSKYKGSNPLIADIRAQIATVESYIKKNTSQNPAIAPADPVYQEIQKHLLDKQAKLSALKVRIIDRQNHLGEMNKEIQFFEANQNQYRMLAAAVSSNKQIYGDYQRKLEEANVYNELGRDKMTSVSVIEPAAAPLAPVNPPKPLILLLAGAIGFALFGSLGIAYFLEINKQVMSTAMEAEKRLQLPVLITIPIKD
ncbi:MAG: Wzz/FepE/Etk N-terminal domain-containing protein [Syntrophobacteraceae bacterium]|nr:Wzz/FepE/Etk N-terminal domain-containing protein [Syntrophobacteraceae bacterium]